MLISVFLTHKSGDNLKSKFKTLILLLLTLLAALLLLFFPKIISKGVLDGMLLCGNILIPALFPFCVLSVFVLRCGVLNLFKGKYGKVFAIFIISLIGGYPVGAKLIGDEFSLGLIDKKTSRIMLCFCVNAGPAFIYTFAGIGVLGSAVAGKILLMSHIMASLQIMAVLLLTGRFKQLNFRIDSENEGNIASVFVESVAAASKSIISVCSFTVIFSGITELIRTIKFSDVFIPFLEITNGIIGTENIYFVSFLLGFGGLCVIMQVYSISSKFANVIFVILTRILHGTVSLINCMLLTKLFNFKLSVFSNEYAFDFKSVGNLTAFSFLLAITAIFFLVSLSNKNYSGKPIKDAFLS